MNSHKIKQIWLDFFKSKGHLVEPSASLIPVNDPSLLWINAGVAPLKKYFEGTEVPPSKRMVNAQKCIRTNDIEQVGKTARHQTFFEMLGNFSMGDYFRDEVIPWAFELLTSPKYYHFPLEKLYFTVYPTDQETYDLWLSLGVKESHLIRSDYNFWEIGEGPCGPSTEIFYDRGDAYGVNDPSMIEKDIENDRFIEIWNIVFSQYQARKGLEREDYKELPSKNIDTGMGLERMACILQNKKTNFETDLLFPIIDALQKETGVEYNGQLSYKVIADHLRSVVFALADGAQLGNEGRGYVLRRLLRRAVKHGLSLGFEKPFLHTYVGVVVNMMAPSYPYLKNEQKRIAHVILKEENKFLETLSAGEKRLEAMLENTQDILSGDDAFKLYDTYGFPVELTEEMALSKGIKVDKKGFEKALLEQKERARNARSEQASMRAQNESYLAFKDPSTFIGYNQLETESKVIFISEEGVVTKETPFYAESGGQLSDEGVIIHDHDVYDVLDVVKLPNGQFLHVLDNHSLKVGDILTLKVNEESRRLTEKNHSVTHLVFRQLRNLLGDHVHQQGSMVSKNAMRFDFTHDTMLSDEELLTLEKNTNQDIIDSHPVKTVITTVEEAKKLGAIAEFGEKYGEKVRMVDMGVTLDLCGGTHVKNTKEIQGYTLVSIESKGSGIYRISGIIKENQSALDGYLKGYLESIETLENKWRMLKEKAVELNLSVEALEKPKRTYSYKDVIQLRNFIDQLQRMIKALEKEVQEALQNQATSNLDQYLNQQKNGNLVVETELEDVKSIKAIVDACSDKIEKTVVFMNVTDKCMIFIKTKDNTLHAGNIIKNISKTYPVQGGGNPQFAQAGCKSLEQKDVILAAIKEQLS